MYEWFAPHEMYVRWCGDHNLLPAHTFDYMNSEQKKREFT